MKQAKKPVRLDAEQHASLAHLRDHHGIKIEFSVKAALKAYLDRQEIKALLKRRA